MVAVLDPVAGTEDAPRRVRFTRREVDRLMDLGAFEGRRFEFIDGDLIDKMGQKPPHAYALTLLMRYLVRLFGIDRLRCQLPVEVAQVDREYSYPEPDLVVTRTADDGYAFVIQMEPKSAPWLKSPIRRHTSSERLRQSCTPAQAYRNTGFWMLAAGTCTSIADH